MKKNSYIFILFFFLVSILLSLSIVILPAHAQTTGQQSSPLLPATDPGVPQDMHAVIHGLFINILAEGICFASGYDPLTPSHHCLDFNSQSGTIGYSTTSRGGLLGMEVNLIAMTTNIPIHTAPYIRYLSQSFQTSVVQRTYAANNEIGQGSVGLDPLLKLWLAFRNIAYLLIVIVFLVIGVGIMLRIKIDPRTVMTLQNQIPKIIIGLLLITFSFAIAGFLIDMTYVLTSLFVNIIATAIGDQQAKDVGQSLLTASEPLGAVNGVFGTLVGTFAGNGIAGAATAGSNVVGNVAANVIGNIPVFGGIINVILWIVWLIPNIICTVGGWIGMAFGGGGCGTNWNGVYDTVNLIVFFAILASLIISLFKFWISLINAYITILFQVILAPLRILLGGLPGAPGGGFGGWMKDMLANLLIFPVCISYIFIAGEMAKTIGESKNNPFVLPMVPGFGIGPIIALAAIFMLPKLPDVVKESLKSKDVFGPAIGQALAPGLAASTGAAGQGLKSFFRKEDPMRGQQMGAGRSLLFKIPGARRAYEGITRTVTQQVHQ